MRRRLVPPIRRTRNEVRMVRGLAARTRSPRTVATYVSLRVVEPGAVVMGVLSAIALAQVLLSPAGPPPEVAGVWACVLLLMASVVLDPRRQPYRMSIAAYLRGMDERTPALATYATRAALAADFVDRHGPAETWPAEVYEEFAHRVEHAVAESVPAGRPPRTVVVLAKQPAAIEGGGR